MKYHTITKKVAVAFRRIILWAGVMTCALSCREEEVMPGTDTGGLITFRILDGNSVILTRAETGSGYDSSLTVKSGRIPMIVGENTIEMGLAVEGNNDLIFGEQSQPLTKGASFGSKGDEKPLTDFHVTAFRDEAHSTVANPYLKDELIKVTDGSGRTGKYWPAGTLSFCAYAYSKENAKNLVENLTFERTGDGLRGSFSYSLPEAGKEDDGKRNDPVNQPDLVFAMTPDVESVKNAPAAPVDLLFHHALSAIVFRVGTVQAENVNLKSISLENFYGKGSCEMSRENNGRNNVTFNWKPAGEQDNTYVLELNSQHIQKGDNTEHWFGEEAVNGEGDKIGIEECTFQMIPQTFGADTKIVLKFFLKGDENEYSFSKPLNGVTLADGSLLKEFRADTKYIFTIGLNGDVDVEVEDKVEGSAKKDLTIQNTGVANGYIRAAIVGYWADEKGNVMDAWDEENDGSYTYSGDAGKNWKKGKDEFWYYTESVPHYGFTTPLFTTYELKQEAIEAHSDQKLILDIVAQIVIEDEREKAGWPTTFEE